jgi:prephenate dehydrogenase
VSTGPPRPTVAVVGLGLVGGSLARALRAQGYPVLGVDRPAVVSRARRARAISAAASLAEAVSGADVVVLAAPPAANLRLLRRVTAVARPGRVITDVGSVKGPIVDEARRLGLKAFTGGHPMAGAERAGFAASRADLFQGCRWILTPAPGARVPATLRRLVRDVGATAVVMNAEEHDRVVAFLSHVPQLVAWALLAAAQGDPVARRHRALAGPGYRDMTRLARSPRALWRQILGQNRAAVARALRLLKAELDRPV